MLIVYGIIAFCFGVGLAVGAMLIAYRVDKNEEGGRHTPKNTKAYSDGYNHGYAAGKEDKYPTSKSEAQADKELAEVLAEYDKGKASVNQVREAAGMPEADETGVIRILDKVELRSYGPVANPVFPGTEVMEELRRNAVEGPRDVGEKLQAMDTARFRTGYVPAFEMNESQGPQGLTLPPNGLPKFENIDPEEFTETPHHVLAQNDSHPMGSQPCCAEYGNAYR